MKTLYALFLTGLLILCATTSIRSQDYLLTQFASAPLQLNPAFAGTTPHYRLNTLFRNQWAGIAKGLQISTVNFDYNADKYYSGFGFSVSSERLPELALSNTTFSGYYSFQVSLDEKIALRGGLSGGAGMRSLDYSALFFPDQLTGNPTKEQFNNTQKFYGDFSAGGLIYSEKLWLGVSLYHLSTPNYSLSNNFDFLRQRFSIHAGGKIKFRKGHNPPSILPAILYQQQGEMKQLDFGANFVKSPLVLGLWFRGLPFEKNIQGNSGTDCIAALVGLKILGFSFNYSYDYPISSYKSWIGGAHEISITLSPRYDLRLKKGNRFIQCPAFYHD